METISGIVFRARKEWQIFTPDSEKTQSQDVTQSSSTEKKTIQMTYRTDIVAHSYFHNVCWKKYSFGRKEKNTSHFGWKPTSLATLRGKRWWLSNAEIGNTND